MLVRLSLFLLTVVGPAWAEQACVTNGAAEALYFRIDTITLGPAAKLLEPDGQICVETQSETHATARVFQELDDLEGCSRLIGSGAQDTLLDFSLSDRCEWATHSGE